MAQIRAERDGDAPAIGRLHQRAFGDHGVKVARLDSLLRTSADPHRSVSILAEMAGQVIGHLRLTACLLDAPRRLVEVLTLSPLGLHPVHQGRGFGSMLVRCGLSIAAELSAPLVVLEGSPGYYRRFGFQPADQFGLRRPSLRIPQAAFQARALPSYEPWMTGTLVYPQAFWDLDAVGLRDPNA